MRHKKINRPTPAPAPADFGVKVTDALLRYAEANEIDQAEALQGLIQGLEFFNSLRLLEIIHQGIKKIQSETN